MGDDEGAVRADTRVDYISTRVQATFPKMVVSALLRGANTIQHLESPFDKIERYRKDLGGIACVH